MQKLTRNVQLKDGSEAELDLFSTVQDNQVIYTVNDTYSPVIRGKAVKQIFFTSSEVDALLHQIKGYFDQRA